MEFLFFAAVLAGVAIFHTHALRIAMGGAVLIALYKILWSPFKVGAGVSGLLTHLGHEWVLLSNLLLLLGFALLADRFEKSEVPALLPRFLPGGWQGGFVLLALVWALSGFLDNLAAAMIGGAIAHTVFKGRVHIGYLAAIVAASNAGGAGNVVGDTTATMIWIAGISPLEVAEAYIAAAVALVTFGIPLAMKQDAYMSLSRDFDAQAHVDWTRVAIVGFILVAAIVVDVLVNTRLAEISGLFPFLGATVWAAVLLTMSLRRPNWSLVPGAFKGAVTATPAATLPASP
ncbi:MAG: citrate transporter [Leptothrix sp. (in: Bacteria)]|nr:citrate transporter [Leptothrix sp. (in: b-proteobacteria)]